MGPANDHIETKPQFEKTRKLNNEWKAVIDGQRRTYEIRLLALHTLADYNVSGPLNALVKKIQVTDDGESKRETVDSFFSTTRFPQQFPIQQADFIRHASSVSHLEVKIDKTSAVVDFTIPPLQPLINFFPNPRYAYYRIILDCTGLSDYACFENSEDYYHQ